MIESRETTGSDNHRELGECPARMFYVCSPGEARLGSLCRHPGVALVRIVLAGPAEAGSDVYVISPGEAGRSHSGSSPIWTDSVDEIPPGKIYSFIVIIMLYNQGPLFPT